MNRPREKEQKIEKRKVKVWESKTNKMTEMLTGDDDDDDDDNNGRECYANNN